jgi:hypothetical protein
MWPEHIDHSLCESQYPEGITYDIIVFQPSLFGSPGWLFQRSDNHEDEPVCYRIPERSYDRSHWEYLIKQADGTRVGEFLNIRHVTNRSENQAINPYLMVMNAVGKLRSWLQKQVRLEDPVFTTALADCRRIMVLIYAQAGVTLRVSKSTLSSVAVVQILLMRSVQHLVDAEEDEEGDILGGRSQDVTTPLSASGALPELRSQSQASSAHLNHSASTKPRAQSWISRGGKASSLENWRQEVGEFLQVV